MINCQHCGKRIPYDANLCPYCGRSIKQFQQKEVLEEKDDTEISNTPSKEEKPDAPTRTSNDKKMLFFVIAVLALLLVVGGIYHYTTMRSLDDDEEYEQPIDTATVKARPLKNQDQVSDTIPVLTAFSSGM